MTTRDYFTQFQLLSEQLQFLTYSERNQLHLIEQWLAPLLAAEHAGQIKAYVRELLPHVFKLIDQLKPIGAPPEFIRRLTAFVGNVQQSYPTVFDEQEIHAALGKLQKLDRVVHAFLGVPDFPVDEKLRAEFKRFAPDGQSEKERLQNWITFLYAQSRSEHEEYQAILDHWNRCIALPHGNVHVPLIEHDLTNGDIADFQPFGTISALHLLLQPLNHNTTKDVVTLVHPVSHADANNVDHDLIDVLDAVRKTAGKFISPFMPSVFSLTLSYDDKRFSYCGSSHGLAVAINAISVLSKDSFDKKYYSINGEVVLTGIVNRQGEVTALPDEIIERKVETVFYSPYTALVIPKDNEETANKKLASLKAGTHTDPRSQTPDNRHPVPNRTLEIIPVRTISDVFDRRRVVTQTNFSIEQRGIKQFRRHQTTITVASLIAIVLMVATYFLAIYDSDTNPYEVRMEGNYYRILNKNGKVLWSEMRGTEENPQDDTKLLDTLGFPHTEPYQVFDLDGDRKNEVLLTRFGMKRGVTDKLYCFDYNGSLRWETTLGKPTVTFENDYTKDPFNVYGVWVGILDSTKEPKILTITNSNQYPCYINMFDRDKKFIGEYYHMGGIFALAVLHRDKSKYEILLTGTHNGFHSPVAIVLDPQHLSGCSPEIYPYKVISPAMEPAKEKYYVRFPASDLRRVINNLRNPYAYIHSSDSSNFSIHVREASIPPKYFNSEEYAFLIYTFDSLMKPIAVKTSSPFDGLHDELYKKKLVTSLRDSTWRADLLHRIEYWNGDSFVNYPTMNRRYVEAIQGKK